MDTTLRRLLGLESARTAIYKFAEGEVSKDEFEYGQVLDQVLFDEKIGYIATLGPTWNLVHDPRFVKIENTFVIERKGMFGGNANVGQSVIGEEGFAGGHGNDLERYSGILGDGRAMLKAVKEAGISVENFQNSDGFIWTIIRGNWPNWFRQNGTPNKEATRLFDMAKAGLVSLINDYAEMPLSDEWVNAESGDLLEDKEHNDPDVMGVYLEIDQLDKAINARNQLRLLAIRVLKQLGLERQIKSDESRLTDIERDDLLRIIYQSEWPSGKAELMSKLLLYIATATRRPYEERLKEQLARASESCKAVIEKIKTGEIKQINRKTEETSEWTPEETTASLDAIMKDPLRRHLFPIYTQAEALGQKQVVELLAPVFDQEKAVALTEDLFWEIMNKINALNAPAKAKTVAEGEESPITS